MRPPEGLEIPAPEFPKGLEWLNVAFLRMAALMGRSVTLIDFWDFARVNSLRTLPYIKAWHERYAEHGLRIVGVHSPGYSFGRDPATVAAAVERLGVEYAVLLDTHFEVWRLYGNEGWPGRYVFDRRGVLRDVHYGEGAYAETELVLQGLLLEIEPELDLPAPLEPLRPEDRPGALMPPQTADVSLPGDRARVELVRDWTEGEDYLEAADAGAAASVTFSGGGAFAVLSGGELQPGLYETDGTVVAESPGLRLHGFQFTPRPPFR